MELDSLLKNLNYRLIHGETKREISTLEYNSKRVMKNSVFFAIGGHNQDGRAYIDEALQKGAKTVILQDYQDYKDGKSIVDEDVTVIEVADVRETLAKMSSSFYNNPSEDMYVIGVTGTKGKTSVSFMIKHILENAGIKTGIIGTIAVGYEGNYAKADNTTPQSLEIQKAMSKMALDGCKAIVMEVSSQGLMDKRVENIDFNMGVFTNISPDHIGKGEHDNFEEYLEYKSHLFDLCRKAVVNKNDSNWEKIVKGKKLKKLILVGDDVSCDFRIKNIRPRFNVGISGTDIGSDFEIATRAKEGEGAHDMYVNLPGTFNVENAGMAISVARELGIPWDIIEKSIKSASVPGRSEVVKWNGEFTVMVDYAHNGIALANLLTALKGYIRGRLIIVFGAGGNRDRNRRFEMGKVAYELADYIIVTSDNPRNENPMSIIKDITEVMDFCEKPILAIPDRKSAIEWALREGREDDLLVIAGKGHETYQIIGDKTIFFDDREIVLSYGKEQ